MRAGLVVRLTVSHLALVLLTLGAFVVVTGTIVDRRAEEIGTESDRALARRLAPWFGLLHEQRDGWVGIDRAVPIAPAASPIMMQPSRRMGRGPEQTGPQPGSPFLPERQPLVLYDRNGVFLTAWNIPPERIGDVRSLDIRNAVPIEGQTEPVGYLFSGSMAFPRDNPIRSYLVGAMTRAAGITAVLLIVVSGAGAWLWSRWLVQPILDLSTASERIARGDYGTRVEDPGARTGHELRDLAERFNRMAREIESQETARRRFVADAAHELRTPLSLVNARIEMLREGVYLPDESQWSLLASGVARMQRLVGELQMLARLDAGRLEFQLRDLDLSEWLTGHIPDYAPALRDRDIRLIPHISGEPLPVRIDPDRFRQVIDNIVSNAIRHSPEGGSIHMTTRLAGPRAEIEIADDGPGIPEAERHRVFERFVRLDDGRARSDGGSGLGLAISAELVARHNGEIGIRGEGGARFYIRIPLT